MIFDQKNVEMTGFLPFPVLASTRLNNFLAFKVSLSHKATFQQKRKVRTPKSATHLVIISASMFAVNVIW